MQSILLICNFFCFYLQRLRQGAASLATVNFTKSGILFGFNTAGQPNESYVLGCAASEDDLPAGTVTLGAFFLGEEPEEATSIIEFCATLAKSKKTGKFLVIQQQGTTEQSNKVSAYDIKSKKLAECNSEIVDTAEALGNLVEVSLNASFRLKCSFYSEKFTEVVSAAFTEMRESINNCTFQLSGSGLELSSESDDLAVEDLYSQIEQFDELADVQIPANMRKKMIEKMQRKLKSDKEALKFTVNKDETTSSEPVVSIEVSEGASLDVVIPIRLHYFVQLANQTSYLFKTFSSSLTKVLTQLESSLLCNANFEGASSAKCLVIPQVFSFFDPSTYCHPITVVFGNTADEEAFKKSREQVHLRYIVPLDKPTFKPTNQLGAKVTKDTSLENVHVGLSSGIKNGHPVTVSGRYLYFHYNQGQMNDSGWGCAYRSLQTIISWFQLQGYLSIDRVPYHKQIQQALVEVGDKAANFVGSSKWIGSQEVCYVLSQLYQIESKIIFVSSGAELANKGRELMAHFQRNGTPIMIGGGVLAHTIIGVHFDETNGDIKFLILDPHFTGDDDLSVIQKKVCNSC